MQIKILPGLDHYGLQVIEEIRNQHGYPCIDSSNLEISIDRRIEYKKKWKEKVKKLRFNLMILLNQSVFVSFFSLVHFKLEN